MSYFNIVAQTTENTVVTEYEPDKTRSDSYQSEAALEKEFIRLAVHQNCHVIAVVILRPILLAGGVLVDDLEAVVVDVLLINEGDILALAGVPPEDLHKVLLDAAGLVLDAVIGVGNAGTPSGSPLPPPRRRKRPATALNLPPSGPTPTTGYSLI